MSDKLYWSIDKLKGWDKNPRSIKKEDFERLKRQITKLGQYKPVLVTPEGEVLGGNMRLKAYKELGMKDIWVSIVEPKTEAEKIEYALSDNDRAGYYIQDQLYSLLEPQALNLNLDDYTIDLKEPLNLKRFLDNYKGIIEDDFDVEGALENIEEPKTKRGDIYQLGNHRLMCGDSTTSEVDKLFIGGKVDCVVTDPPYNVDYSEKNKFLNSIAKGNRNQTPIKNDKIENFGKFISDFLRVIPYADYNIVYLFTSGKEIHNIILAFKDAELYYCQDLKWIKNNHVLGRLDYNPASENIIYGWKGKHKFYGGFATDVLKFDKPVSSKEHPTMKPIALLAKLIRDGTEENMVVYDGFGGSGSTLIACEQLNRKCYMMELDERYCDVIISRWELFSGKKAVKLEDVR